jgi:hypothetical protein
MMSLGWTWENQTAEHEGRLTAAQCRRGTAAAGLTPRFRRVPWHAGPAVPAYTGPHLGS